MSSERDTQAEGEAQAPPPLPPPDESPYDAQPIDTQERGDPHPREARDGN